MFDLSFYVDAGTIIFNNYANTDKAMVNTMILIIKQYIYVCKCSGNVPRFIECAQKIAQVVSIEKSIAIRQNKLKKHEGKWRRYIEL